MTWRATVLGSEKRDLARWRSLYDRLPRKGPYHAPDYLKVLEFHFDDPAELFVFGDQEAFVYYPYFRRSLDKLAFVRDAGGELGSYCDIASSWYYGGPLSTSEDPELIRAFRKAFHEHCGQSRVVCEFIRFDPYLANHHCVTEEMRVADNREVVYIDLRPSEEEIVSSYQRKCRKNIRRAVEGGVRVETRKDEEAIRAFHQIYGSEMQRKGAPPSYLFEEAFFRKLFERVEGACLRLIFVGEHFAGGSVAIQEGEMVNDYLRATDPEFWHLRINDLVIHENARFFKGRGAHTYDLQGGRVGVFEFKLSFSRLTRSFKLGSMIHLPEVYDALGRLAPKRGDDFFPAYREKDTN